MIRHGVMRLFAIAGALFVAQAFAVEPALAGEAPRLGVGRSGKDLELRWPASPVRPDGTVERPWFEVQHSPDLVTWRPVENRVRGAAGETLVFTLPTDLQSGFYRILAVQPPASAMAAPGAGGAEVFGYQRFFEQALERLGEISTDEFARLHPSGAEYLPGISWDPTSARFWDAFNADPNVVNVGKQGNEPGYRTIDYRLDARELSVFRTNGFVVSQRLAKLGVVDDSDMSTFGNCYYQLWYNDLPVFISTDSILQAWHRTYLMMVQEMEETFLARSARELLQRMSDALPGAWASGGTGVLRDSLLDADYLLTVARRLLSESRESSRLGQDARVDRTMEDIQGLKLKTVPDFLGHCRTVDFSQFTPRGHYVDSVALTRYFRCMMWLGRIDLPVAGGPFERCVGDRRHASPRELGTALVLAQLLRDGGGAEIWRQMDAAIGLFVGWNDSLTFPQLEGVLAGAGVRTLADVRDLATLERIQSLIEAGELGIQNIRSDAYFEPLSDGVPGRLPQSFLVFGQRFVPDSWVMSKVVFDSIVRTEGGVRVDIQRRVPGSLDVAFAVLGNNQVVPEIISGITRPNRKAPLRHVDQFRDGFQYQHNLAAARATIDAQRPEAWETTIAMGWMGALRELSAPTTDVRYPEAMRTRNWAMRTLNTQLASWAQYRHDTVLYAKQSYSSVALCFYPAGFVEPRPEFWGRLGDMARRAGDQVASLTYPEGYVALDNAFPMLLSAIQSNQVAHLRRFAGTVDRLRDLSVKELAQEPFSEDDEAFIQNLMQGSGSDPHGCGSTPRYSGWYPALFYRPMRHTEGAGPWIPRDHWVDQDTWFHERLGASASVEVVADVHTNPPAQVVDDPGSVLHQAVGGVGLMVVAIDNGNDRMVYAGPVHSHYEFETIGQPYRMTDSEWYNLLWFNHRPWETTIEGRRPPPWTDSFLVP